MEHEKPLLLLDIDGVLIPFGGKPLKDAEVIEMPWGQALLGSPSMRGRLAALREEFELVWATMWQDAANEVVGPWHSLPQLPFISFVNWAQSDLSEDEVLLGGLLRVANYSTYKLPAVREYVGKRAVAWIDDHLFSDGFDWMNERNAANQPTLLVRTDPVVGMSDEDVEHLLAFAQAVKDFRNGVKPA